MKTRKLTGKWYIKRKLFGFKIMVETIRTTTCPFTLSSSPEFTSWEKALKTDLIELKILIV